MISLANDSDKIKWNKFVAQNLLGSFLQSWQWGDFQESLGNKVFRLKITHQNKIIGVAQIIKHKLPRNLSWLYCPRGPVLGVQNWNLKVGQELFKKITQIAKFENAIFLRTEPKQIKSSNLKIPQELKNSYNLQPATTSI